MLSLYDSVIDSGWNYDSGQTGIEIIVHVA